MPTLAIIGSRSFADQARAEAAFKRYYCDAPMSAEALDGDIVCQFDTPERLNPQFAR